MRYRQFSSFFSSNHLFQFQLRQGSRGNKFRLSPKPIGDKLTKKEIKSIKRREKEWIKSVIREDEVEDPYGQRKADHYVEETHKHATDSQKELLCTGHTFRVN